MVVELFQKLYLQIYASQSMTPQIIPLIFVLFYLESVERKGKITKVWISQEWKELFWWSKKILFIVIEGLSFGGRTKIW